MEFLDGIVLIESSGNIFLLELLNSIASIIFIAYSGLVTGKILLSFLSQGECNKYVISTLSRTDITKPFYSIGLGFIPLLSSIILYSQLLHTSDSGVLMYLSYSIYMFSSAVVLLFLTAYIERKNSGSSKIISLLTLIVLVLSILFFFSASILSINNSLWNKDSGIFTYLFDPSMIIKLLQFVTLSIAFAGAYVILSTKKGSEASTQVKERLMTVTMSTSLLQPVFIVTIAFMLPEGSRSLLTFLFVALGILSTLFIVSSFYLYMKNSVTTWSRTAFAFLSLLFCFIVMQDSSAFSTANSVLAHELKGKYNEKVDELAAKHGAPETEYNGEEIYKSRCMACHNYDKVVVGPAHKDVLPKYNGNVDALTEFILDPVKVDPKFPPMANQGLKPKEAKAVAEYLLELADSK